MVVQNNEKKCVYIKDRKIENINFYKKFKKKKK